MSDQHYDIVMNDEAFQVWRDCISAPGGDDITTAEQIDAQHTRITFAGASESQPAKRWEKAQDAEAAFWKNWRENDLYRHISLADFWADVVNKTGGPLPGGRILDVGCGPVSVLNFEGPDDMTPLGLDPLGLVYAQNQLLEAAPQRQPMPIVAAPAEKLPFRDASFDHVICYNVLDHVLDAPGVLAEIRRVLKDGGSLRVYVHTFAWWIRKFLFFDTPHTYHWSHVEFRELIEAGGFEVISELEEPKSFDIPAGLMGKLKYFPYWVASKVAATSYFQLRKA